MTERSVSHGAYAVTNERAAAYDHAAIERKWQARWAEDGLYRTPDPTPGRPKFYCLEFFPYPSGNGLSVGHGRNYVPSDVIARYHRMRGRAVLHPMGWDAFGLPAENEAIKRGVHPADSTRRYAANYKRQLTLMGCSYDWDREINSSAPEFYRWTQWFFLLLYRRGLAYRAVGRQWWCPGCQTVLANEQVDAHGVCWRGHAGVYKRDLEQWYFRITAYADQLLADLDTLDWPDHIVAMQRNWIGRSAGVQFALPIVADNAPSPSVAPPIRRGEVASPSSVAPAIEVYTTRPDTLPGVTFVALAPEHPLVDAMTTDDHRAEVTAYCESATHRGDVERLEGNRARTGVYTGSQAVNPLTGERVPVYVADYVLMGHGTGAIMGVPGHDDRDFAFARAYGLPIRCVISPGAPTSPIHGALLSSPDIHVRAVMAGGEPQIGTTSAYTGPGLMTNAGQWDGLPSAEAADRITAWLTDRGLGQRTIQYKMRDWLISRQRYWGAPIPIVYCDRCGTVPVPDDQLPVLLPPIEQWAANAVAGDDGRSPLAALPIFVNTTCPECGGPARRETDTLDGFACSSWYFLRFVSPAYTDGPFDPTALAQWGRPDLYTGGAEHAVMHLLYARFWTKVMADAGIAPFREPFPVLRSQGTLRAADPETGELRKMSKSLGNVVTPDEIAETHGADALRVYLLFMAPFENSTVWEAEGINGARRFLERTWRLVNEVAADEAPTAAPTGPAEQQLRRAVATTIREVTDDIEHLAFNTAVAALMKCLNALADYRAETGFTPHLRQAIRQFIVILAPFAPHIAEELWQRLGGADSVHQQPWPEADQETAAQETVTIVVQVDGRVRDRLELPADTNEAEVQRRAQASPAVQRALAGRPVARTIFVPGRLLNLVTR